jgi:hypothetical protein
MKKIYILLVLLFAISITGCDKDECSVCHECKCICPNLSNQADAIADTLNSGTWNVTYFLEDGELETSDYNGNIFAFNDSGIVTVSTAGSAIILTGNWRLLSDSGHEELNLAFTQPEKFKEFNDDWDVIEWTDEIIRLEELCDDDTGIIDYLTFSKN